MIAKVLMISGLIVIAASILMIVWGIYSSFAAMENVELTGMNPVIAGLDTALYSSLGSGVGTLIFIVGLIKLISDRKKANLKS